MRTHVFGVLFRCSFRYKWQCLLAAELLLPTKHRLLVSWAPRAPLTHSGELGVGTRVCATLRNKRPRSDSSGAGGFPSPSALDALGPRPGSAPGTAPPLRGWLSTGTSGTRVNATSRRPGPSARPDPARAQASGSRRRKGLLGR